MAQHPPSLPDLYDRFGIAINATPEEVAASFRRLSKQVHPDTGGSPEAFARLQRERDILLRYARDPARRSAALAGPAATPTIERTEAEAPTSTPIWTPGLYPALAIASIYGLWGLVQLDRDRIVAGALAGIAVWLVITAILALRAVHVANVTSSRNYLTAEEVVRMGERHDELKAQPVRSRPFPRRPRVSIRRSPRNVPDPHRGRWR